MVHAARTELSRNCVAPATDLLNILSFLEVISNEALLCFGNLGKNRLGFGFAAQEQEVVSLGAGQSLQT